MDIHHTIKLANYLSEGDIVGAAREGLLPDFSEALSAFAKTHKSRLCKISQDQEKLRKINRMIEEIHTKKATAEPAKPTKPTNSNDKQVKNYWQTLSTHTKIK